ncbi:MAG TPA: dockerin type I repeat-containing protein, partial [bacterium]|nr:dockerin type I repeat-containing protein [bacterium]
GALRSPCIDAGNLQAQAVCFSAASPRCLNTMSTHITGSADSGLVDLGFHYEPLVMPTFTPEPTWQPPPTVTPTPPCIHHGDVNFSGTLTAADAQMIFNIVLGLITPTAQELCAADCNGGGTVTAGDSQTVFYKVLGIGAGCVDPLP